MKAVTAALGYDVHRGGGVMAVLGGQSAGLEFEFL